MLSLNADGKQVTYLLLRGYQWVNFYNLVGATHHVYYVIGAPQEAGQNPDVSAASQYGGLACLPPVWVGTIAR